MRFKWPPAWLPPPCSLASGGGAGWSSCSPMRSSSRGVAGDGAVGVAARGCVAAGARSRIWSSSSSAVARVLDERGAEWGEEQEEDRHGLEWCVLTRWMQGHFYPRESTGCIRECFCTKNELKWPEWHRQKYARSGVAFFEVCKLEWHFSEWPKLEWRFLERPKLEWHFSN